MLTERVKEVVDAIAAGDFDDDNQLYHIDLAVTRRVQEQNFKARANNNTLIEGYRRSLPVAPPENADSDQITAYLNDMEAALGTLPDLRRVIGSNKGIAQIAVETHGRLRRAKKDFGDRLTPEQNATFTRVARLLLEHGFGIDPDQANGDGIA